MLRKWMLIWGALIPGCLLGEPAEFVNVEFRCLAMNSPLTQGVYTQAEGGEPIRIYVNKRTDWVRYQGPNPIVFYREVTGEDGEARRQPIAQYDVRNLPESALLLFSKSSSGAERYQVQAINDDFQSAPGGSYRLFNFTEKSIAGMINRERFQLAPKASAFAQVSQPDDFEVVVQLAENLQGTPKRLYASSWTFSDQLRYLVFILPSDDRTRGNIQIRLVSDRIE